MKSGDKSQAIPYFKALANQKLVDFMPPTYDFNKGSAVIALVKRLIVISKVHFKIHF